MKFGFNEILLWSNHGEIRKIQFERCKINLITGKSGMGKTSIMEIIDYCFLSSKHKIPHSIINENVSWYGVKFYINENQFVICRKSPTGETVSNEYFFSNTITPAVPKKNIDSDDLKKIINNEFSITDNTTLSHGGNHLKADSKISFRYFMLFNTISGDIITNTNQYFDKQSEDRYREALPRIFDLALKIDNVNNILNRELKDSLQKKINRELQKGEIIANKASFFDIENKQIYKESLSLGIKLSPESKLDEIDYTQIFANENSKEYTNFSNKIMELYSTKIKIKRLQRLKSDYDQYKKNLANNLENLLPIELIYSDESVIKSSEFYPIIDTLSTELKNIKSKLSNKQPLEIETYEHLKKLNAIEKKLQEEIDNFPVEIKQLKSFNQLITSIGKVNAKKELFTNINNTDTYNQNLVNSLQDQLNSIDIFNIDNERELVLSLINEIGNKTLKLVSDSLDNYGTWNFYFNYKDKITQLRKPSSSVTENVGSSSNHMFLHLLHFLTLHHVILLRQSPYIPSFLLIDQLSRPYYGTDNTNKNNLIDKDSDRVRVHSALNLLNQYINDLKSINHEFQMILIEHIPKEYIQSFENFHIVENFNSENPLIPKSWY